MLVNKETEKRTDKYKGGKNIKVFSDRQLLRKHVDAGWLRVWHGVKCERRLPCRSRRLLLSSDMRSKVCGPNNLWTWDHASSERVQSRSDWRREGASAGFSAEGTYCMSIEKLNSWLHRKTALITSFISVLLPPSLCHDPNRALLSVWTSTREFRILDLKVSKAQTTPLLPKNLYCPSLLASNHQPPLCCYPSSIKPPPHARLEESQYKVAVICLSDLHGKQSDQSSKNHQHSSSDWRRPVTLKAGLELRTRTETALKISRRYNLQPAIARLKETAFPLKSF